MQPVLLHAARLWNQCFTLGSTFRLARAAAGVCNAQAADGAALAATFSSPFPGAPSCHGQQVRQHSSGMRPHRQRVPDNDNSRPASGAGLFPPAAITAVVSGAGTTQDLLDAVRCHGRHFNHIHIAATITRAAKLASQMPSEALLGPEGATGGPSRPAAAAAPATQGVPDLEQQQLTQLLLQMAAPLGRVISQCGPREISNCVWAYAKARVVPPEEVLAAAAAELLAWGKLVEAKPQELAALAWGFVRLGYYDANLLQAITTAAAQKLQQQQSSSSSSSSNSSSSSSSSFTGQHLGMLVFACARAGHSDPSFLAAAAEAALQLLPPPAPQQQQQLAPIVAWWKQLQQQWNERGGGVTSSGQQVDHLKDALPSPMAASGGAAAASEAAVTEEQLLYDQQQQQQGSPPISPRTQRKRQLAPHGMANLLHSFAQLHFLHPPLLAAVAVHASALPVLYEFKGQELAALAAVYADLQATAVKARRRVKEAGQQQEGPPEQQQQQEEEGQPEQQQERLQQGQRQQRHNRHQHKVQQDHQQQHAALLVTPHLLPLVTLLSQAALRRQAELTSSELAQLLHSIAAAAGGGAWVQPPPAHLEARQVGYPKPHDNDALASSGSGNVVGSISPLEALPSLAAFHHLASLFLQKAGAASGRDLAAAATACIRVKRFDPEMFDGLATAATAVARRGALQPSDIKRLAWAFGQAWQQQPPPPQLQQQQQQQQQQGVSWYSPQFPALDHSDSAAEGEAPETAAPAPGSADTVGEGGALVPGSISTSSSSSSSGTNMPITWQRLFAALSTSAQLAAADDELDLGDVADLACAWVAAQVQDNDLMEALARPLLAAAPTCSPNHLVRAISAFVQLHHPDSALLHKLLFTCLHRLREFDASSLVATAAAFSALPPEQLPEEGRAQLFGAIAGRVVEPSMVDALGEVGRWEVRRALEGSGCTQLPRVTAALQVL